MAATTRRPSRFTSPGEYKRLLIDLLPGQGSWTDRDYLWLTDHTSRLIEFTDGYLEVLPLPTDKHQTVLQYMFLALLGYMTPLGGKVHFSGIRLRIRKGKFREPDVLLVRDAKDKRRKNRFWTGADLTLEVVSKDKPKRDLVDKRGDYAEGRVPEYWIVDPQTETIIVLRLSGKKYVKHGVFGRGEMATSALLPGFSVVVDDVFDAD